MLGLASFHLIRQVRRQPTLDFSNGQVLALSIILDLILGDEINGEIAGFGMAEVETADGGGGVHGEALRQFDD